MGLHIWYSLCLPPPASFDEAVRKMTSLHEIAPTVGFEGAYDVPPVGELQIGTASDAYPEHRLIERPRTGRTSDWISVPASRWVRFSTMPGLGTETAHFSLGEYPEYVDDPSSAIPIRVGAPPGLSSTRGHCKTHYANRYGEEHFLRRHLALIRLLEHAQEMGIVDHVSDDGQYWETRSELVLLNNLREHSAIMSAIVGNLKDQLERSGDQAMHFCAPIMAEPNFEHLELEGKRRLSDLHAQRKQRESRVQRDTGRLH